MVLTTSDNSDEFKNLASFRVYNLDNNFFAIYFQMLLIFAIVVQVRVGTRTGSACRSGTPGGRRPRRPVPGEAGRGWGCKAGASSDAVALSVWRRT